MPELIQTYNCNSFSLFIWLFIYNIWKSNYDYVNTISKLYLCNNYISVMIILTNILGLYLFLKKISFEVTIKVSIHR